MAKRYDYLDALPKRVDGFVPKYDPTTIRSNIHDAVIVDARRAAMFLVLRSNEDDEIVDGEIMDVITACRTREGSVWEAIAYLYHLADIEEAAKL